MFAPEGNKLKFILLYSVLGFLGYFPDGYSGLFPNTAIDSFKHFYNQSYIHRGDKNGISTTTFNWLWSTTLTIWFPGFLIGNFLTPIFADKYGRRIALIVANSISLIGTCIGVLALQLQTPELFIISRLILSIGPGMSFIGLVLFMQETAATENRGLAIALGENAYVACGLLGVMCGWQSVLGEHLRILAGVGIPPSILAIVLLCVMQESPKFLLINKNDRQRALKAIEYYQGRKKENEQLLDDMKLEITENDPEMSSFKAVLEVFKIPHLRKAYLVGTATMQVITVMVVFQDLSTDFFENHFTLEVSQYLSFGFVVANFIGGFIGLPIIDRIGRRPLYLINFAIGIVCMLAYVILDRVAFHVSWLRWPMAISIAMFSVVFGISLSPIAFAITTEMVAQKHRSLVQTMVFSTNTILNFAFAFFVLPAFTALTSIILIPLFVVPSILCFIFLYFQMPETCGREVYEVVEELIGKTNDKISNVERL